MMYWSIPTATNSLRALTSVRSPKRRTGGLIARVWRDSVALVKYDRIISTIENQRVRQTYHFPGVGAGRAEHQSA